VVSLVDRAKPFRYQHEDQHRQYQNRSMLLGRQTPSLPGRLGSHIFLSLGVSSGCVFLLLFLLCFIPALVCRHGVAVVASILCVGGVLRL